MDFLQSYLTCMALFYLSSLSHTHIYQTLQPILVHMVPPLIILLHVLIYGKSCPRRRHCEDFD